jgi:hypothetical protein
MAVAGSVAAGAALGCCAAGGVSGCAGATWQPLNSIRMIKSIKQPLRWMRTGMNLSLHLKLNH